MEEAGSIATRAQKSSKALGLINRFTDSIRKLVHEALEMPCLQIPQTGQWGYPMLSTLHLCMASSPCAPMDCKCKDSQAAHKHIKKAWPTLWDWKKASKPEQLRALPWEKQTGDFEHPTQLFRVKRNHTILGILFPGGNVEWLHP